MESKHKEDLNRLENQFEVRESALQNKLEEYSKLDYAALSRKSVDQHSQIQRLEGQLREADHRHEEDRARLLRVSEIELRAANERFENNMINLKDQHTAELLRKESEWRRQVAQLEAAKASLENEKANHG